MTSRTQPTTPAGDPVENGPGAAAQSQQDSPSPGSGPGPNPGARESTGVRDRTATTAEEAMDVDREGDGLVEESAYSPTDM
jgi:hypothetical protein